MSGDLEVRRVRTQTAGIITVAQENLCLHDLQEFCRLAEAHGVEPDVVVTVKEAVQHIDNRGGVRITTLEVPAPVVFAYSDMATHRRRRLRRSPDVRKATVIGVASFIALGPVVLIVDLLWRLIKFAFGWL